MARRWGKDEWSSVALAAIFFLFIGWSVGANQEAEPPDGAVISLGGSVTEIVFALGEGHRLVARDSTSTWPETAETLPDVGYVRALSPEGVLSMEPEIILSIEGAGPPEAVELLASARIPFVEVPEQYDSAGVVEKIRVVGEALDVPEKAAVLADRVKAALAEAEAKSANHSGEPRRVMFVLSLQGGRVMASGQGTAADGIIRMAGGVNALADFEGYKPVSDEAIGAAAPDVILMMDRGGNHSVKVDELFDMAAFQTTPAAQTRNLVQMNGLLLLGFGPRTAEAVTKLSTALYQ